MYVIAVVVNTQLQWRQVWWEMVIQKQEQWVELVWFSGHILRTRAS